MARHSQKRKARKGRIFVTILVALLILVGVVAVIGYFQYQSSLKEAQNDSKLKEYKFNGVKADGDAINVLLIGSDSRGADQGRSDSLMIAHYNTKTNTPKLVSIMRDTYVDIPGHGKNKINAAYSYGGPELVRQTIKENFGVDVEYYVVANFEGFPKIVDTLAPEGIKINAEKDMSKNIDVSIKKGEQVMDGKTLLQYARFRKDAEGDFGRIRRQQQVLEALKEQALDVGDVTKIPDVIGKLQGYSSTNIPNGTLMSIGADFLLGKTKTMEKFAIPVEGKWHNERIEGAGSVLRLDDMADNAQALQDFLK
ncbi:LCP family protein [Listeria welshimeri]|uniref:Regulatory protein MsrR n=1 Tax=Listeria welshimeri serovar 6b (strain ATCC 35897 / DSM 20650 / CCUG 15529 / CIP 8149 / NCTC 11857 / SLCC 5334 / V8) TaxID=386043 RepID=A0AFS1_LISW6|nr:LCP family protein [Listeria welshimeri]MBC1588964.1 LCP family protein [Listeria welshimeri]CAK19853.1 transcriptional regulator, putative [Listeria welshimeri serovar 6b str. SLCC5334]SNV18745.1 Regulatory protein msrR [Listeria welshimeri]